MRTSELHVQHLLFDQMFKKPASIATVKDELQ